MDGWRSATVEVRPRTASPWARPTAVVVLPSPSGVGVIAVTRTYVACGRSASAAAAALPTFATWRP